jgi:hypothetical protein
VAVRSPANASAWARRRYGIAWKMIRCLENTQSSAGVNLRFQALNYPYVYLHSTYLPVATKGGFRAVAIAAVKK